MIGSIFNSLSKKKAIGMRAPRAGVTVRFANFWNGFEPEKYFGFLNDHFEITDSNDPDFIIFYCFEDGAFIRRMPEIKSTAVKIFFTGENVIPDMSRCDYAISFCHSDQLDHPKHFRIPNYVFRFNIFGSDPNLLIRNAGNAKRILNRKKHFCNFIYSNEGAEFRKAFFTELCKYKRVDSAGKVLNNMKRKLPGGHGSGHQDKINFMSKYKFTIAFENSSTPGYTTEKIVEAFYANTVPIYWGDPSIERVFNTKSFINLNDYGENIEEAITRVVEADQDDNTYLKYLEEPIFMNNELPSHFSIDYVTRVFATIFNTR